MTTSQLLRCKVRVKISMCPTNPAWEEWECKAQGRNLTDTVQKAALEALTTFCGKHPDEIAGSAAKVIPVPGRHTVPCVEREAFFLAQGSSHYSLDLVTSVRFSEATYDTSNGWWEKVYSIDTKSIGTELKKWSVQLKR
jgi:hypothetical protein